MKILRFVKDHIESNPNIKRQADITKALKESGFRGNFALMFKILTDNGFITTIPSYIWEEDRKCNIYTARAVVNILRQHVKIRNDRAEKALNLEEETPKEEITALVTEKAAVTELVYKPSTSKRSKPKKEEAPKRTRKDVVVFGFVALATPFLFVLWTKVLAEIIAWGIPSVESVNLLTSPFYWSLMALMVVIGIASIQAYFKK